MAGEDPTRIVDLLKAGLPCQARITEGLRLQSASWLCKSGWSTMPTALEHWIMWASVRIALNKDPGFRCRTALRQILGEEFYLQLILLCGYAKASRNFIHAYPELDGVEDPYFAPWREKLLAEAPEVATLIAKPRSKCSTSRREARLLCEIAHQDRVAESLRNSERRFRNVIQNVPFPVMIYAEDGEVVTLNQAWIGRSGWTEADLPDVRSWYSKAQGDPNGWSAADVKALYGWREVVDEGECRIRTRSGESRTWDFTPPTSASFLTAATPSSRRGRYHRAHEAGRSPLGNESSHWRHPWIDYGRLCLSRSRSPLPICESPL